MANPKHLLLFSLVLIFTESAAKEPDCTCTSNQCNKIEEEMMMLKKLMAKELLIHGAELTIEKDYSNAAKYMAMSAEAGNLDAQTLLFVNALINPNRTKEDLQLSWKWLLTAAEANHSLAFQYAAKTYFFGNEDLEIEVDGENALKWLTLCTEPICQELLELWDWNQFARAALDNGDGAKAVSYFLRAIEEGSDPAQSQSELAWLYFSGEGGIAEDKRLFWEWSIKSAENGHLGQMEIIWTVYYSGYEDFGVDANKTLSWEWVLKAAELGSVKAMHRLSMMYLYHFEKIGIERNEREGYKWLVSCAELNYTACQNSLGWFYFTDGSHAVPTTDKANSTKAVYWYQRAAKLGNAYGKGNLAVCYTIGAGGLPVDHDRALELYRNISSEDIAEVGNATLSESPELQRVEIEWYRLAATAGESIAIDIVNRYDAADTIHLK